jgi:hypothetical protein
VFTPEGPVVFKLGFFVFLDYFFFPLSFDMSEEESDEDELESLT